MAPLVIFLAFLSLAACAAYAVSVDDIARHATQNSWHAGKNLQPGDYFLYAICDYSIMMQDECYTVRLDFALLLESGARDVWVVQAELYGGDHAARHVFAVDVASLEISTIDFDAEARADSVRDTVFFMSRFAPPQQLAVGSSWGPYPSVDPGAELVVASRSYYDLPDLGDVEVYLAQNTLFETSTFAIHRDVSFPVHGIVYDPYWTLPNPGVEFVFELLETSQRPSA